MTELKPCPFCGRKTSEDDVLYFAQSEYSVMCMNGKCSAQGPYRKTEKAAIAAWNKRAKEGE